MRNYVCDVYPFIWHWTPTIANMSEKERRFESNIIKIKIFIALENVLMSL